MDGTAFIISPIGGKGSRERQKADEILEHIILPAVERFDIKAIRSDQDPTPGQITSHIIRSIAEATVIIGDLTGHNPNVYYELGVAHSFGKATILMVDDPALLPFDTRNERAIRIGTAERLSATDAKAASQELETVLSVVLTPGYSPANIVTEAASHKSLEDLAPSNPAMTEIAQIRGKVDSTEQTVLRILDEVIRPERYDDYLTLRRFVHGLTIDQRLTAADLRSLPSSVTSPDFDQWVLRLTQTLDD